MDLLTIQEAAETLKVSPITIRRHIAGGRLKAVKAGKVVRIPRDSLQQLLAPIAPAAGAPQRLSRRTRCLTPEDALWELVGAFRTDEPTDASRKHEYLAEAIMSKTR